jgi:hypothetical protein
MADNAFKINDAKAKEVKSIMLIPLENVKRFSSLVCADNSGLITSFKSFKELAKKTLLNDEYRHFIRNCLSLRHYSEKSDETSENTLLMLRNGLSIKGWPETDLKSWDSYALEIGNILKSDSIYIISKIADLALTHENHLHSSRIISEMRPVFDKSYENIKAFIVYNDLMLSYHDNEEEKALTISLTLEDLESLKDSVDRALKKTEIAVNFGNKNTGAETVLYSDKIFEQENDVEDDLDE